MEPTVAKPLEEEIEPCSCLVTHPQAFRPICPCRTVADVVLEQTLRAIVREALRELDDGNQVRRRREVLADAAQRALLMLAGLLAVRRRCVLGIIGLVYHLLLLGSASRRRGNGPAGEILLLSSDPLVERSVKLGSRVFVILCHFDDGKGYLGPRREEERKEETGKI